MAADRTQGAVTVVKKVLVIENPLAGGARRGLTAEVLCRLSDAGCEVSLYRTRARGDALNGIRQCRFRPDMIAVAGGDGTVNEVVNALTDPVPLALIPCGTTNVLALELGIRQDAQQIADSILSGQLRPVCPGKVNGLRFVQMAGVGYDAWVVQGVNLQLKQKTGKLAYVLSMLQQLSAYGRRSYRVTVDGQAAQAYSLIMTNGRFYAGTFVLSRRASLAEPQIQVLMMQGRSRLQLLLALLALPFGQMERIPGIRSLAARSVRVESMTAEGPAEPVQADGDVVTQLPLLLEMEERPLLFAAPEGSPA
ncbi:MAG: YegS/Rv2252/BmrU family lipid kinase [Pseudomonadota bacterium]|nr:YegS/Rv2252/BmrU family lipid kinase [Pseudomonadota bacterium]